MPHRFPLPLILTLVFVVSGCALLPYTGFQNDESLFASGIYEKWGIADTLQAGKRQIPLMLMSYVGALKSWIYTPIFQWFPPNLWSVRLPVVLLGAATLWLLHRFLCRVSRPRTAFIALALLATEPTNLLTTTFDWGPVALQHFLGVGGMAALAAFAQTTRTRYLVLGFGAFGLGMWDKALFAWFLSGVALAAMVTVPGQILRLVTFRRTAIAFASFFIGALPLLLYNTRYPFATFQGTSGFSLKDAWGKAAVFQSSLNGSALFGYIPRDNAEPESQRPPSSLLERMAFRLDEATGGQNQTWGVKAAVVAVLLLPWLWFTSSRQLAFFSAAAIAVGWIQMAATNNAGGSAHHCVLLWPLPQILVAAALGEIAGRFRAGLIVASIAAAALFCLNTLVLNHHLVLLVRNGPTAIWSDAILTLSDTLAGIPAKEIYLNDWGLMDSVRMAKRGSLPLRVGSDPLSKPDLSPEDIQTVTGRLKADNLFVAFTDGNEVFAGVNRKMGQIAETAGFKHRSVVYIKDRNGRTLIEVFRYLPDE